MENNKFIELHVYDAMVDFLHDYAQRRYGYGTLQEILKELSPLPEGGTSNPAMWAEWKRCINRSLKEPLNAKNFGDVAKREYTKFQSFNAMIDFLIHYFKRTSSGDLSILIDIICSFPKDYIDKETWNDWNNAAKKALQNKNNEKFTGKFVEKKLTELQAYNSMIEFLEWYYKKTTSDFMGGLITSLFFFPDGKTADPVFWEDWEIAIKEVLQKQNKKKILDEKILGISITELQAFRAMVQLFKNYFKPDPNDPDAIMLFDYLHLLPDSSSESPIIREKWKQCVDEALQEKPGIRRYLIWCRD